ncbi:MAG: methyl-accepting chemotaxis protein [Pseudomonadota bacterium]
MNEKTGEAEGLLGPDEKKSLLSTLQNLRNAQAYALNAAAILIEVATAPSEDAWRDVARQFSVFRELYAKTIKELAAQAEIKALVSSGGSQMTVALEIASRFASVKEEQSLARVAAVDAGHLVQFVRLEGVPAIMDMGTRLARRKKAHEKAVAMQMKERMNRLDKMFGEVEDIGRMIHLISLNASVEAARAGGESGRSFKVIADEIRGLAQQAATLIDATRAGVLPGVEADMLP